MVIKSVFLAVQTNFSLYKPIEKGFTNHPKCLHNQVDFIFSYIVIFFLPRWLDG